MTPRNAWVYAVLPFVTMAVLTFGFVVAFRQRAKARRASDPAQPRRSRPVRPRWANPWIWLGVCLVAVLLGLFVWPWLFGLTLIVVPFAWIRRPRREPRVDPRSNGHAHRDAGSFTQD